jgi:putative transposase
LRATRTTILLPYSGAAGGDAPQSHILLDRTAGFRLTAAMPDEQPNPAPRRKPPYNPGLRDLVAGKRDGSSPLDDETLKQGFRGWHERGYLPHRDEPGLVQFVTFRLADCFPQELRGEWEALFKIEEDQERRRRWQDYLDLGRGACWLKRPEIAALVEDCLCRAHGAGYELRAWMVMPNHVHALIQTTVWPMSRVVGGWKSITCREANRLLGRAGSLWAEDYWDTYQRDAEQERRTIRYIENNPAKAKLVLDPKAWPWSSARRRDAYGRLCW